MRRVRTMTKIKNERVNFSKSSCPAEPGPDFMRMQDLLDGEYYYGHCRNASCARWSEKAQEFTYMRQKFGTRFAETINHPAHDDGCDLFVPLFRCYPTKEELCPGDEEES